MNLPNDTVWRPQDGPQKTLIDCPLEEIFYGGARGGGKTDGTLGKYAIKAETYGDHFNGLFFRKELPMLDDAIERSHEIYGALGGRWHDQKKTWRFPSGGRLRFRPLESVDDAGKYQGQNVTDACVEEAGNYPDPRPIDRLNGILRSAHGVPTQLILTGNPGGPGQTWIKHRYIDPNPLGMEIQQRVTGDGIEYEFIFIPSKLQNNRILMLGDPKYVNRLHRVGSVELVRAWLEGDWSAVEGAYFDCWSTEKHVVRPFDIPKHCTRFRSFDWGSASPFSVGWWAILSDDIQRPEGVLPRGAMVRYREWYGAKGANIGLKLTAEQVAEGIRDRELGEDITYGVADGQIFEQDGGPSIAERMLLGKGVLWRRADKRRIPGWEQMRARLIGVDDRPMLYVFSTCKDFIRTVPVLQHDERKPEDLDTESEDHAADEARYGCMSRPFLRPEPKKVRDVTDTRLTFNDLLNLSAKRRRDAA